MKPGIRRLGILALALLVAGAALSWLLTAVRWKEAYLAMDVQDPGRHALALALTDGDAPLDLPEGPRLHRWGSLVRLRYDILDTNGVPVTSHEVRALVPRLPTIDADMPGLGLGELQCLTRCREGLAARDATVIERGGKAGIADEWVLRLPEGQAVSLGRSGVELQDIAQAHSRRFPVAPMRVTLLEACPATVRIGTATHLEYFSVPVPRALRTTQWVQVEGCGSIMNVPPSVEAPETPKVAEPVGLPHRSWVDRADWEAIRPAQSGSGNRAVLVVDEAWLAPRSKPRLFHLLRACRYEPATRQWIPLPPPEGDAEISLLTGPGTAAGGASGSSAVQRLAYRFPAESALYFAEWTEIEDGTAGPPHQITLPSGASSCIDVTQVKQEGEILACVPQSSVNPVAARGPVPDPALQCAIAEAAAP